MKIKNKSRVGKLENTIVKKGYSKIIRIRTLKDLIEYYDDDEDESGNGESKEEPEVEFCLEPGLRNLIDDWAAKNGIEDDEEERTNSAEEHNT